MPLASTGRPSVMDSARSGIGFWMRIDRSRPIKAVWVVATFEALAQLDPTQPRDASAAFATVDSHRVLIEMVASKKFDQGRIDESEQEGQSVLVLRSDDIA